MGSSEATFATSWFLEGSVTHSAEETLLCGCARVAQRSVAHFRTVQMWNSAAKLSQMSF